MCGDSGPNPEGGGIGYRVAFQAGGGASPWSPPEFWRSRIGTGLVVRDWVEGGIHIHPPLPGSGDVAHIRLDRRDGAGGNLLECRTEDGTHVLAALHPDGRLTIADGLDPSDAVTRSQLDDLRREQLEVTDTVRSLQARPADLSATPVRALGAELGRRLSPLRPAVWRSLGRRAARLRESVRAR